MNLGKETEMLEFKKMTGEMKVLRRRHFLEKRIDRFL